MLPRLASNIREGAPAWPGALAISRKKYQVLIKTSYSTIDISSWEIVGEKGSISRRRWSTSAKKNMWLRIPMFFRRRAMCRKDVLVVSKCGLASILSQSLANKIRFVVIAFVLLP